MNYIIIAADLVPTESNFNCFENADIEYLIGKGLTKRLNEASFIAMNLEVPLTNTPNPIRKCGPHLIAPVDSALGIHRINPYFFTLANNHILDQGVDGLISTMEALEKYGISYAGAGLSLEEAKTPFLFSVKNKVLGIYCCADHEFSIATKESPGANPYDPLTSYEDVRELKDKCDYLIVLFHGGIEQYRYPSPQLQRMFHKFADVGANLVVAQHSHCIGCKEDYHGSTLIYGQGNFLFDNSDNDFWSTSVLIQVNLNDFQIEYIPIIKVDNCIREAPKKKKEEILQGFYDRSFELLDDGFVETHFKQYATEMKREYYSRFSGGFSNNILFRLINKLSSYSFINYFYKDSSKVAIQNVLDCEAHRELASMVMNNLDD